MKIGIFECDYVPESLQDKFTSYPDMLIQAFKNINCEFEYIIYDVIKDLFPKDINECDAYITTGSRYKVNDGYFWITRLEEIFQKCQMQEKKLIGICFGHQLLAKTLGGEVRQSETGPGIGIIENQLLQKEPWMEPQQKKFNMIINHEDQIIKMPEGATLLASNSHCNNFMFQFGNNFLGIQGHPEFNNDFSRSLITVRAELIPNDILKAGYASLLKSPDRLLIMKWIANFLGLNIHH